MFTIRSSWRTKSKSPSKFMIASILVLTLTSACNAPSFLAADNPTAVSVGSNQVDAFVDSLPSWTSVSPEKIENNGVQTGATPAISEESSPAGELFTCTSTQYSITKNPSEIAMYNPDASVLWPGALIRGSSHLQDGSLELLAVSREKRAPLGISIQGGGVLGIQSGVSTIVDQPVGSTIREGINQLVANALGSQCCRRRRF